MKYILYPTLAMLNRLHLIYITLVTVLFSCTDGLDFNKFSSDSTGLSPQVVVPMARNRILIDSIVSDIGVGDAGFSVVKGVNGDLSIRKSLKLPLNNLDFGSFLNTQGVEEYSVDLTDQPFRVVVKEILPLKRDVAGDQLALYDVRTVDRNDFVEFNAASGGQARGFNPNPNGLALIERTTLISDNNRHNLNIPYSSYQRVESTVEPKRPDRIIMRVSNATSVKIKSMEVQLYTDNTFTKSVGRPMTFKDVKVPTVRIQETTLKVGSSTRQAKYNNYNDDFKADTVVIGNNFILTSQVNYKILKLEFESVGPEALVANPVKSMPETGIDPNTCVYLEVIYEFNSSEKTVTVLPNKDPLAANPNALHPVQKGDSRLYTLPLTTVVGKAAVDEKVTYYAVVESGKINIDLEYVGDPNYEIGSVDFTFNKFISPEQRPLTVQFSNVRPSSGKLTQTLDISGYALDFRGTNQGAIGDKVLFYMSYDNLVNRSGTNLVLNKGKERVELKLSFENIKTSQITGTFTGTVFPASFDKITLGQLSNEKYQNKVRFLNPSMELKYKNTLGVPSRMSSKIYAYSKDENDNLKKGDSAYIDQRALNYNRNKQLDDIIKIEVAEIREGNVAYEDVPKVLRTIPDELRGVFNLVVDPPVGGESSVVTFTNDTKLDMDLNINLPLIVQLDKLLYYDTIALNGAELKIKRDANAVPNAKGELEYGYLIVGVVNRLPVDLSGLRVRLYGTDGRELTSSLAPTQKKDNTEPQKYPKCRIGTAACVEPTKTVGYITVTTPIAEALESANRAIIEMEISTDNNTGQRVQIFSEDFVKIGFDIELNDPKI